MSRSLDGGDTGAQVPPRPAPEVEMSRLIVKVGGAVAAESASRILRLAEDGHDVIVVHGAGPQITTEMKRRGITVEFVQGRRRTSHAALDVVRESMEDVNASLCAA